MRRGKCLWNGVVYFSVAVCSCLLGSLAGGQEGLGMEKALRLGSVTADRAEAPVHSRVTLSVDLDATYENPFDSDDIRVDAHVSGPGDEKWTAPAFLYRPYERGIGGGAEKLTPTGDPAWRVRLSFPNPGDYGVVVSATDRSGTVSSDAVTINIVPADVPGMIRRCPNDHRYFVTDRGETFFLFGANVCWGGGPGTHSYDRWLPKYADAGCNFFRVWLSPGWTTFAMNTGRSGFDGIDLANAWRLDYVLGLAERLGMRAMVCIDSFNILRTAERTHGGWESSAYVAANGGPLERASDYFTKDEMLDAYRDRLRYLVARYGASTGVFAWEFWNEVDLVDGFDVTLHLSEQPPANGKPDLESVNLQQH